MKKIAEQNGGKHEVAIYASNCGNISRMLPICGDWEVFSLIKGFDQPNFPFDLYFHFMETDIFS